MTTVVNQPAGEGTNNSNNLLTTVLSILLILGIVYVFFAYALPALRNTGGAASPQINVPSSVDVNLNKDGQK